MVVGVEGGVGACRRGRVVEVLRADAASRIGLWVEVEVMVVEVVVEVGDGSETAEVAATAVLPVVVKEGVGGAWRWGGDVACHGELSQ